MKEIILKKNKEISIKRFHPWIFSGAIKEMSDNIEEGELVKVFDHNKNFLGIGFYQPDSISVKLISFEDVPINDEFWEKKICEAINLRVNLGLFSNLDVTNVFRLIHAEGDNIPGLVVDYYNGIIVIQCHSAGIFLNRFLIAKLLLKILGNKVNAIYNKSSDTLPFNYKYKEDDGFIFGSYDGLIEVKENNNKFLIDFINGQKTGFFIDQRENRILLTKFVKNKTILNLFSYTGAFAIYASNAGCFSCINVESSKSALKIAELNSNLNGCRNIINFNNDIKDFFKNNNDKYDIIIVDPPAFAKHIKDKSNALKGYTKINKKALNCVKKEGIIFTFSCSQVISLEEFKQAIFIASAIAKKDVSIIFQLSQPPDHPVNVFCPETNYLKGLVLYVK
ncbi:MAG: class I SAM-dependent rRNA methyltransferase [Bacteroidales bacterium]|nr:class I SAM-dependent rRNA methyltransferase [Bacteroidales bacterium]